MKRLMNTVFRIGDWRVDPASGQISRDGATTQLDLRAKDLLLLLAERAGEIVSIESLIEQVWNGVAVTPDSVYQSVMSLRRLLGDDAKQPRYIATVPRRGYRMIATVAPCDAPVTAAPDDQVTGAPGHPTAGGPHIPRLTVHRRAGFLLAICAIVCVGLGIRVWLVLFHGKATTTGHQQAAVSVASLQNSVVVLPFLDLTEGMKQGEFTDGMTEELIDQLSKVPGLRIPSPTSSFYFRDKQIPVSDVANKLGVAYVLDGSVRKSGARVRVAARLVRADTGYVMWSETYDRPWHYTVMVQDEIAEAVTKAVRVSLVSPSSR
jgi:transcriptional activator of cad operon